MNKRQRKKHRLLEFQELGFRISCIPCFDKVDDEDALSAAQNRLLDTLVEFANKNNYALGGGIYDDQFNGFVTRWDDQSTEVDRTGVALFLHFLQGLGTIYDYYVHPLEDAWYEQAPIYRWGGRS